MEQFVPTCNFVKLLVRNYNLHLHIELKLHFNNSDFERGFTPGFSSLLYGQLSAIIERTLSC